MASVTAVPTLPGGRKSLAWLGPRCNDVSVLTNRSGLGATVAHPLCASPQASTSPKAVRCARMVGLMSERVHISQSDARRYSYSVDSGF